MAVVPAILCLERAIFLTNAVIRMGDDSEETAVLLNHLTMVEALCRLYLDLGQDFVPESVFLEPPHHLQAAASPLRPRANEA